MCLQGYSGYDAERFGIWLSSESYTWIRGIPAAVESCLETQEVLLALAAWVSEILKPAKLHEIAVSRSM